MAKEALASEDLAKKFATEKETPYTRWVKAEGLDIIPALYVRNLRTVDVKPWARRGGNAVFVNHDASRVSNDSYVMEIPPGKKLEPHRQLYEEMILVRQGRAEGPLATNELRGRRDQPSADQRQGARRRRRPHPLQHGQGLDEQPHLAVPGRHLQEGPRARAGRLCDHSLWRGLFADVAGR